MSKVISFRLSQDNPRESQALNVLESRLKQGYSMHHTITDALLSLDNIRAETVLSEIEELKARLSEISIFLTKASPNGHFQNSQDVLQTSHALADDFVASVKQSAKPGVKYAY
jgi:hypothetical protein